MTDKPWLYQKGHTRHPDSGRKRNRYPERIYWEEVKQTLGLSTLDLARELGVCVRTVECWERGEKNYRGAAKRPPPPVMILVKKLLLIHELQELWSSVNATVNRGGEGDLAVDCDDSGTVVSTGTVGGHDDAPK